MKLGSLSRTGTLGVAILLAAALAVPAAATARITVPPGSTEGDQYFEEAPNGAGSGGVNKGDGTGTGGSPVAASSELNKLGADGQAAAAIANANRPTVKFDRPAQQTTPSGGGGGMGFWFPLILAGTAVAAVAFLMRRRLNPA